MMGLKGRGGGAGGRNLFEHRVVLKEPIHRHAGVDAAEMMDGLTGVLA